MKIKITKKMIILTALFFTAAHAISAQITTAAMPPDLIVIQKKWRSAKVFYGAQLNTDDAFRANDEQREFSRATAQNMRDNEVRAAQGLPPLPPPTRGGSTRNPTNPGETTTYVYEIKIKNTSPKTIRTIAWQYLFFDSATNVESGRRDFISTKKIAADKTESLKENSYLYPTVTIDASKGGKMFKDSYTEQIIIQRIEYDDGTIWKAP